MSAIEWTDETWNPVTGCTKVSPGCAHCYIERQTPMRVAGRRFERGEIPVHLHPERLDQPHRWRRPRMVFVNSMSDLFHEEVPDEFIDEVFDVMAGARQHTFQVLTKRPERARSFLVELYDCGHDYGGSCGPRCGSPLPNVWLGVSIENARFTWRADVLREIPAAVRFISAEPLLGSLFNARGGDDAEAAADHPGGHDRPALANRHPERHRGPDEGDEDRSSGQDSSRTRGSRGPGPRRSERGQAGADPGSRRGRLDLTGIDWLIVGGESGGRDARPMHPDWARELRDACLHRQATQAPIRERTAFFFKQWGSWAPAGIGDVLNTRIHVAVRPDGRCVAPGFAEEGDAHMVYRGARPKSGGRLLDGREWNEMPLQAVAA